jgi:hypothetical protein
LTASSHGTSIEMWKERESVYRQLQEVLTHCPLETLDSNGTSMVVKMKDIARPILTEPYDSQVSEAIDMVQSSKAYVEKVVTLLAELDVAGEVIVKAE